MNKSFVYAMLATATLFASCSSQDELSAGVEQGADPNRVPIEIGIGSTSSQMRGTGAVGEVDNPYWAGQSINIYMVEKGKMTLATDPLTGEKLFNNAKLITPKYDGDNTKSGTGVAKFYDGSNTAPVIKYYPAMGEFDFYGYRIDDAVVSTGPEVGNNDIKITFTVDGTQDVLAAKTIENYEGLSDERKSAVDKTTFDNAKRYSASAARKDIQPELLFTHMMSRLTFEVKAGTPSITKDAISPVYVTGISVRPVKTLDATGNAATYVSTTGTLTIASTTANQQLVWNDAATEEKALELKRRWDEKLDGAYNGGEKLENRELKNLMNGVEITEKGLRDKHPYPLVYGTAKDEVRVGESVIAPEAMAYEVVIEWAQVLPQHENTASDNTVETFTTTHIVKPTTGSFNKGNSYNILVTIYGLEQIEITAQIKEWENGGNITVDADKE